MHYFLPLFQYYALNSTALQSHKICGQLGGSEYCEVISSWSFCQEKHDGCISDFFFLTSGSIWDLLEFLLTHFFFFIGLPLSITYEFIKYGATGFFLLLPPKTSFVQLPVCISVTDHGSVVYTSTANHVPALCLTLAHMYEDICHCPLFFKASAVLPGLYFSTLHHYVGIMNISFFTK